MRKVIISTLFAATIFNAATPASANQHFHGGHGGFGLGGAGLVFGLAAAVIGSAVIAEDCTRFVPVYDAWGNYVGRRAVNIC